MITVLLQAVVVLMSNSVGLLADTIHNVGDAATAIPLGVAFWLARRGPTRRFTYGLGRVEDLAGIATVITILVSAVLVKSASDWPTGLIEGSSCVPWRRPRATLDPVAVPPRAAGRVPGLPGRVSR